MHPAAPPGASGGWAQASSETTKKKTYFCHRTCIWHTPRDLFPTCLQILNVERLKAETKPCQSWNGGQHLLQHLTDCPLHLCPTLLPLTHAADSNLHHGPCGWLPPCLRAQQTLGWSQGLLTLCLHHPDCYAQVCVSHLWSFHLENEWHASLWYLKCQHML